MKQKYKEISRTVMIEIYKVDDSTPQKMTMKNQQGESLVKPVQRSEISWKI